MWRAAAYSLKVVVTRRADLFRLRSSSARLGIVRRSKNQSWIFPAFAQISADVLDVLTVHGTCSSYFPQEGDRHKRVRNDILLAVVEDQVGADRFHLIEPREHHECLRDV